MQPVPAQGQLKHRRHMPSDQDESGDKPANRGMGDQLAEFFRERQTKKWTRDVAGERLRNSAKEREFGSTEQEQRRSDNCEEQVLHHVDGERHIVQGFER